MRRPLTGGLPRTPLGGALLILWLQLLWAAGAAAQGPAPRLEGRVVVGHGDSIGAAGTMVVLHLIASDSAGQIDSVRAGPDGAFGFTLPSLPDPLVRGEVYIASVTYDGILYFGPAVHEAGQLQAPQRIEVFDTAHVASGGAAIPIVMRYIVLDPAEEGWSVTDVFQVENSGERTLVSEEGQPVWRYPLPAEAFNLEASGGDARPEAFSLVDGEMRVAAPIPPGVAQYLVQYRLPRPRLEVPLPGVVGQVELLVREPAPVLTVQGLMANQPAEMEPGVTYRRFSGLDLRDTRILVLPGVQREGIPLGWVAVILAMVLAGGALWALQRPAAPVAAGGAAAEAPAFAPEEGLDRRQKLLLEVAELDERLEGGALEESAREALTARRSALLAEIRRLG